MPCRKQKPGFLNQVDTPTCPLVYIFKPLYKTTCQTDTESKPQLDRKKLECHLSLNKLLPALLKTFVMGRLWLQTSCMWMTVLDKPGCCKETDFLPQLFQFSNNLFPCVYVNTVNVTDTDRKNTWERMVKKEGGRKRKDGAATSLMAPVC